jgi:hypothetical protein
MKLGKVYRLERECAGGSVDKQKSKVFGGIVGLLSSIE